MIRLFTTGFVRVCLCVPLPNQALDLDGGGGLQLGDDRRRLVSHTIRAIHALIQCADSTKRRYYDSQPIDQSIS